MVDCWWPQVPDRPGPFDWLEVTSFPALWPVHAEGVITRGWIADPDAAGEPPGVDGISGATLGAEDPPGLAG